MVRAALAAGQGRGVCQLQNLVDREHRSLLPLAALSGDQRRAECTHDAGDIRTDRLAAGDHLEAAKDSIIIEGTALYDNMSRPDPSDR